MAAKRILMLVGDYVEDYEAMVPLPDCCSWLATRWIRSVRARSRAIACGRPSTTSKGDQTYSEKRGHNFAITAAFDAVDPTAYDALVIPGGRAPEYLRLNSRVLEIVRHFSEAKKPIAAICHGPQVLAAAGVLSGRQCMAYPAVRPEVATAGATWCDVNQTFSNAVADGNFVTAAAWGPAIPSGSGNSWKSSGRRYRFKP